MQHPESRGKGLRVRAGDPRGGQSLANPHSGFKRCGSSDFGLLPKRLTGLAIRSSSGSGCNSNSSFSRPVNYGSSHNARASGSQTASATLRNTAVNRSFSQVADNKSAPFRTRRDAKTPEMERSEGLCTGFAANVDISSTAANDLASVVEAWPTLPDATKQAILNLVDRASRHAPHG